MAGSRSIDAGLMPRPRRIKRCRGEVSTPIRSLDLVTSISPASARRILQEERFHLSSKRLVIRPLQKSSSDRPIRPSRKVRHTNQWYALRIRPNGITLFADAEPGFRYGLRTLAQLLRCHHRSIPCMDIEDWPDFAVRGVMLDISRDKVPTMATLKSLITRLADWKINQLQLYTEHTFAYRGHQRVWLGASPMTASQIKTLDRYCRRSGIELVPNQNSFGHMERWLKHKPYAHLAETTRPWTTPWGNTRAISCTLNPLDPRSLALVTSLYDQLLPHFSSRLFNVGCDETFELGQGRSAAACRRRGVGSVYLDYLLKLHRAVRKRGRQMLFWSDIVHQHPEVIPCLPKDAIALIWGYEADHPFNRQCAELARAGLKFYVCPGTSSWCSFAGRTDNCTANLRNAAAAGLRHRADGFLITDWGDFGHRQYLPVSYLGFLYGAAVSWCRVSNAGMKLAAELSRHVFDESSTKQAQLWLDAGRVHGLCDVSLKNKTVLFAAMQADLGDTSCLKRVSTKAVAATLRQIEKLQRKALSAHVAGPDALLNHRELIATLAVLRHAAVRMRYMLNPPRDRRGRIVAKALAADMRRIIERHRILWLARNRPGGLTSSLSYYKKNLREYLVAAK